MNDQDAWERKAREYESALAMLQTTGEMIWVINGAYLLATTVLLGALLTRPDVPSALCVGGGFAGELLCLLWWGSFQRNYTFYNFRIEQARLMERVLGYRVLSEGKRLSDGETVELGDRSHEIRGVGRLLSIQQWTQALIGLMALLFLLVILVLPRVQDRTPGPREHVPTSLQRL